MLVVGAHQDAAVATGYLNAYRLLLADLVVRHDGRGGARATKSSPRRRARADVRPEVPVIATVLRPRPAEPVDGRARRVLRHGAGRGARAPSPRTCATSTAPRSSHVSGSLADRHALRESCAGVDAEMFLVELKAAAIDVVAEEAHARGVEVVLAANDVVPLPGEPDLDAELRAARAEASRPVEPS